MKFAFMIGPVGVIITSLLGITYQSQVPQPIDPSMQQAINSVALDYDNDKPEPKPGVARSSYSNFELLEDDHHDSLSFIRVNDKASGVEFLCVYHSGCVLTGRTWKK